MFYLLSSFPRGGSAFHKGCVICVVYSGGVVTTPTSKSRAERFPAPVAFRVMLLPVVAPWVALPPVAGLVLQPVPFHTPRLRPTSCALSGARATMVTVTAPSVVIVKMWVKAPFFESVPVKVSVDGFDVV